MRNSEHASLGTLCHGPRRCRVSEGEFGGVGCRVGCRVKTRWVGCSGRAAEKVVLCQFPDHSFSPPPPKPLHGTIPKPSYTRRPRPPTSRRPRPPTSRRPRPPAPGGLALLHLGGLALLHLGGLILQHLGGHALLHLGGLALIHLGASPCILVASPSCTSASPRPNPPLSCPRPCHLGSAPAPTTTSADAVGIRS